MARRSRQRNERPGPSGFLVVARRGHWALEHLQVGTNRAGQPGGLDVAGPALVELRDVRIRTRQPKGAGILAQHGGRVHLAGEILLNEHLRFASADPKSFSRIKAEYGGVVKFTQRAGASLTLGNGNLAASTYGIIELGCERAAVTSWNYQSNPIAVNNSGRIELKGTTVHLTAHDPRNTPIGLEHDGHVMAEGSRMILDGQGNAHGIVLQKASTMYGGTVEIRGEVFKPLVAMSCPPPLSPTLCCSCKPPAATTSTS